MDDEFKETPRVENLSPLTNEELQSFLKASFDKKETDVGQHSVLDTQWQHFLDEFGQTAEIDKFLKEIYQRDSVDILDEGCGSSLTVFQAVEDAEKHFKKGVTVKGYGITASSSFLNRGVESPAIKEEFLRRITDEEELKRTKLLLDGIQYNEEYGYHRFTLGGNLIRIKKEDLHFLSRAFPGQKFDLIYSSSTYPHLSLPWLAFTQSCNVLKKGGLLLIDSVPTQGIIDENGNEIPVEDYQKHLQEVNPTYRFDLTPIPNNPFYFRVVIKKLGEEDLQPGLYIGVVTDDLGIKRPTTVFSKRVLQGYTSVATLK